MFLFLDTFYEFMFVLTFMSILITLVCLALSRVRRTVPASHSLYLSAKVCEPFKTVLRLSIIHIYVFVLHVLGDARTFSSEYET